MNSMLWLAIAYACVCFGIGGYLAFLCKEQRSLRDSINELKNTQE